MCTGKSNCTGTDHSLPVTLAMLIVCVGITVHYIDQNFNLQQELLAFKPIEGQHTGQNFANIVFKILEEYNIKTKFFCVTMDNSSNNFMMAKELQKLLADEGIQWDTKTNYIPCLIHIINLVLQKFFSSLAA